MKLNPADGNKKSWLKVKGREGITMEKEKKAEPILMETSKHCGHISQELDMGHKSVIEEESVEGVF